VKTGKTSSYNADPKHVSLKILPPARDKKTDKRSFSNATEEEKNPDFVISASSCKPVLYSTIFFYSHTEVNTLSTDSINSNLN
jgi:hypothetical protein